MPPSSGSLRRMLAGALLLASFSSHGAEVAIRILDQSGAPLGGVVVVAATHTPTPLAEPTIAEINQEELRFIPEILVVQSGTEVSFPNRDDVMHHVYSFSTAKTFELPLYQSELPPPVEFERSGVAVIGCNIHDHMVARVVVVDTPYFGTTDADGWLRLDVEREAVASLIAWHPGWGDFGDERRELSGESKIEWKVRHGSAGKLKEGALAWNEDY